MSFCPLPLSKSWFSAIRPRLLIFHSTISLPHKKFLFQKFLMTSLYVVCGLAPPPIKNPGYAYDGAPGPTVATALATSTKNDTPVATFVNSR